MKKLFLILPVVAALAGCSGMTTLRTVDNKKQEVPSWYLNYSDSKQESSAWFKPWDKTGFVYAVGEDVSPSMEMSVRKATLKAKAKLADRVRGELTNRTIIKYEETSNAQSPVGRSQAQDTYVNVIAETVLQNYGLAKKEVLYDRQRRNYRAFVMIKLSQEQLDTVLAEGENRRQTRNTPAPTQSLDQTADGLIRTVRQQ
jgi:uncharacterized protein YceK